MSEEHAKYETGNDFFEQLEPNVRNGRPWTIPSVNAACDTPDAERAQAVLYPITVITYSGRIQAAIIFGMTGFIVVNLVGDLLIGFWWTAFKLYQKDKKKFWNRF